MLGYRVQGVSAHFSCRCAMAVYVLSFSDLVGLASFESAVHTATPAAPYQVRRRTFEQQLTR